MYLDNPRETQQNGIAPTLLKGISSLVHHITSPTPGTTITEAGSTVRARTGTGGLVVPQLRP
ncbi:hypothetical protein IJG27_00485, partial [Candidatus Saccharibacteria bacterium]|nr:hypothetical protein [Candidatus Saccharibacteria bacterium]MBQ6127376.1 hypothetical protein [Candidatus Saccharibacteria bacterium]